MKKQTRSQIMKASWARRKAEKLENIMIEVMQTPVVKPSVLDDANEVIYGDREKTYGDPGKNLRTIATYWETYLVSRGLWNSDSEGLMYYDVARMMELLKIARLGNTPDHRDSSVDLIGYEALVERVQRGDGHE